jgi:hypothetical protein
MSELDFTPITLQSGARLDLAHDSQAVRVLCWHGDPVELEAGATHYGMVTEGCASLVHLDRYPQPLVAGMFFVAPGEARLDGTGGSGLVISFERYQGLPVVGGPLEPEGRLRYIDGCSDTVLVAPPRLGDPCLNHLHVPPGVDQSPHTHPSARIGVIVRGSGECRTPNARYQLTPGMGWYIPAVCLHSFHTAGESLDVIAWHPDSDFGPTDDHHPMINRTILRP